MTRRTRAIAVAAFSAVILMPVAAASPAPAVSTPIISNVDPSAPIANPKAQVLTITGQEFMQGLTLTVANPAGNTTVLPANTIRNRTDTSFQATVTLAVEGTHSLTVTNTDGGVSPPFAIGVKSARAPQAPVINKITPAEPSKRPDAQPLLIEGQNFVSGLRAVVTDPMGADVTEATVGKVTPNSFEIVVKLEHAGEYSFVVTNPSGAVSNVRRLLVR
jgi:hypothetical protein